MRFSAFSLLIVAGIAQHASASPIRVILTEVTNVRFGHAMAPTDDVARVAAGDHSFHMMPAFKLDDEHNKDGKTHHRHHPGCGHSMKDKGLAMTNAFRQAMGLPLIEKNITPAEAEKAIHGGLIRIMPMPFMEANKQDIAQDGRVMKPHHGKHHGAHHHSFMMRIHRALMSLGPWEGRAVAFVIGCGLGVLLRMFWVIAIVTYRLVKGGDEEDVEYGELVLVEDTEELVVAPPQYTDEKVAVIDNKAVAV